MMFLVHKWHMYVTENFHFQEHIPPLNSFSQFKKDEFFKNDLNFVRLLEFSDFWNPQVSLLLTNLFQYVSSQDL